MYVEYKIKLRFFGTNFWEFLQDTGQHFNQATIAFSHISSYSLFNPLLNELRTLVRQAVHLGMCSTDMNQTVSHCSYYLCFTNYKICMVYHPPQPMAPHFAACNCDKRQKKKLVFLSIQYLHFFQDVCNTLSLFIYLFFFILC